jgi:hypothetical protein
MTIAVIISLDYQIGLGFTIVTHNKRTMASTDIIYGITMIEARVPRVVALGLRELALFVNIWAKAF